jgi:putative ABC transport system permease protein
VTRLARAHLRDLVRDRWQAALAILGIAVGVAVVVAVDLVNASSREAMRVAQAELSGRATHRIVGPGGRVDERRWAELRLRWRAREGALADVTALVPVIEGEARLRAADGAVRPLRVLGVDVVGDAAVRALVAAPGDAGGAVDAGRLLVEPDAVALDARTARAEGIEAGDAIVVETALGAQRLVVVGLLPAADARVGAGVLLADLATAQERLGRRGWLTRVDAIVRGASAADAVPVLERLFPGLVVTPPARARDLGDGLRLEPLTEAVADTRALASSFQLNLAAMSLLALVVGLFLIHGTLRFAVLRRQRRFGVLRAIGVTPAELRRAVLLEATVLAGLGVVAGLVLGRVLAGGLLGLVSATLEGLYEQVAIGALAPDPVPYLKGALVGLGGSLAVAVPLARHAAAVPPRDLGLGVLSTPTSPRRALARAALCASLGLAALPGTGYVGGLIAVGGLLLAGAALAPTLLGAGLAAAGRLASRAPVRTRALLRDASRGVRRSGVAAAALVVAVATAVGMTVMVDSFRGSVERWLEARLGAPVYVRIPADVAVPERLSARLDALAGGRVERLAFDDRVRRDGIEAPVTVSLARTVGRTPADLGLALLEGAWDGRGALLSEPLARRLGVLGAQDATVTVAGLAGAGAGARLPVAGVFREYGAARGTIVLPASRWPAPPPGVRTIELHGVADVDGAVDRLGALLPPAVGVRRNTGILELSLAVFDRTFRVTAVLQTLAGAVAAFALFGALTALGLERRAQYGVLRALGVERRGPALANLGEAVLVAAGVALLALPLGVAVAVVLVEVVNVRAFGWSLDLVVAPGALGQALVVAVVAGALAALGPAVRVWRTPPLQLLADARALG